MKTLNVFELWQITTALKRFDVEYSDIEDLLKTVRLAGTYDFKCTEKSGYESERRVFINLNDEEIHINLQKNFATEDILVYYRQ